MRHLFWNRVTGDPPEDEKPLIGNHNLEAVKLYADVGMVEEANYTSGEAEGKPLSGCLTDDMQEEIDLSRPKDFAFNCKTSQRG